MYFSFLNKEYIPPTLILYYPFLYFFYIISMKTICLIDKYHPETHCFTIVFTGNGFCNVHIVKKIAHKKPDINDLNRHLYVNIG